MQRRNIVGMDVYDELRVQARRKRDNAIEAAREAYAEDMDRIDSLQAKTGHLRPQPAYGQRRILRGDPDAPISTLTLAAAAERVLMESKPLRMVELVVELRSRGVRSRHNPRRMANTLRSIFRYHKARFVRDTRNRWTVI